MGVRLRKKKETIMSIYQASIFICEDDDPNSVRGYRATSEGI